MISSFGRSNSLLFVSLWHRSEKFLNLVQNAKERRYFMKRTSSTLSIIIVFILTIFSVYTEFFCYYFFQSPWVFILVTSIFSLLLCHTTLQLSHSFYLGIIQTYASTILCTFFIAFIYFTQEIGFIPFHNYIILLLLLNWCIPFFYYLIRYWLEQNFRFGEYYSFFWKTSYIFLLFYLFLFIWKLFLQPIQLQGFEFNANYAFYPFWNTASYIENYIYYHSSLIPLIQYIAKLIILFIPFGFYLWIMGRHLPVFIRIILLFAIPAIFEGIQWYTHAASSSIDDYAYSLFGCFIGVILYLFFDQLFLWRKKRSFLEDISDVLPL